MILAKKQANVRLAQKLFRSRNEVYEMVKINEATVREKGKNTCYIYSFLTATIRVKAKNRMWLDINVKSRKQ